MTKARVKFEPQTCKGQFADGCGQTLEYLLALDRGTTEIVIAIAAAIRRKGINAIHPTYEMEVPVKAWTFDRARTDGVLTSNHLGNLSRAHRHGLIASVKGERGNWLLTTKGASYLHGARIPKYAIVSKTTGHQEGYFEPEALTVTVRDALGEGIHWDAEGIDFTIEAGRIILNSDEVNRSQGKKVRSPSGDQEGGDKIKGSLGL